MEGNSRFCFFRVPFCIPFFAFFKLLLNFLSMDAKSARKLSSIDEKKNKCRLSIYFKKKITTENLILLYTLQDEDFFREKFNNPVIVFIFLFKELRILRNAKAGF